MAGPVPPDAPDRRLRHRRAGRVLLPPAVGAGPALLQVGPAVHGLLGGLRRGAAAGAAPGDRQGRRPDLPRRALQQRPAPAAGAVRAADALVLEDGHDARQLPAAVPARAQPAESAQGGARQTLLSHYQLFFNWLVLQGQSVFEAVLAAPELVNSLIGLHSYDSYMIGIEECFERLRRWDWDTDTVTVTWEEMREAGALPDDFKGRLLNEVIEEWRQADEMEDEMEEEIIGWTFSARTSLWR